MTRGIVSNLVGERFGHLVVESRTESDKQSNAQWLCSCDCGTQVVVRGNNLRKGQQYCSKTCKLYSETIRKDLAGQVFGNLTAVSFLGVNDSRKSLWSFKCSCGTALTLTTDAVFGGKQTSCGKGVHASSYKHGLSKTRAYHNQHYMKYTAAKRNQTPKWVSQSEVDGMVRLYAKASELSKSGVLHEVDHIYPLQGKTVSGLHTLANLQIVTRSLNRSKTNRHPDDVC